MRYFCLQRLFIPIIIMGIFALLTPSPAVAALEPREALEKTVNSVLNELKKPELHNASTRDAVLQNVERMIVELFSFEELSMRTVGPTWRNFSADQKKRFIDAFENLLRERYVGALREYSGETVSYIKETPVGTSGDKIQIDTIVNVRSKPVPMNYRMIKKDRWVVYDILIEGVSLVQNYRSQFQAVLQRGNGDELIEQVNKKAEEIRVENNKQAL